jgi:hypothetical protein
MSDVLMQIQKSAERSKKLRRCASLIGFTLTIILPWVVLVKYPGDDGWSWYYRLESLIPFICLMSYAFTVQILGYSRQ